MARGAKVQAPELDWLGETQSEAHWVERSFVVRGSAGPIPGFLLAPESATSTTPLVLIGHGGFGHKRKPNVVALAQRFAREHRIAAVAIDGPVHGERRPPDLDRAGMQALLASGSWLEGAVDGMVADWQATLDALGRSAAIRIGPVGYWGLSLGALFGVPLVAAEPRIKAAVFGLMGTAINEREGSFQSIDQRLARDAGRVQCPVMFVQQLDDEFFPAEAQREIYDLLATRDKEIASNPGRHAALPPEVIERTQDFLAEQLSTRAA